MTATEEITPTDLQQREAMPELLLKLRISETCRRIARLSCHVADDREFADVAAHDIADGIGVAAAAIWELDRTAAAWTLIGSAGDVDRQPLRTLLQKVRMSPGARSEAARAEAMIDDVDHLVRAAASPDDRSGAYHASSAILLRSTSRTLRVLATWSHRMDDDQLHPAMEAVAHDVSQGFDAIVAHREKSVHAKLFCALFEGVPLAVAGVGSTGTCTRWNCAVAELFGWDESVVLGRPLRLVAPRDEETFRHTVQSALHAFTPVEQRCVCQRSNGSTFAAKVTLIPTFAANGAESEVLLVITDQSSHELRRRLNQCELDVALCLSKSQMTDVNNAQILQAICQRLEWRAGEIWQLSDDGERWHCNTVWKSPEFTSELAASITIGRSLRNDVGLPAEVRRARNIVCAESDDNLHDIALPIDCDNEVRRVVVFLGARIDGQAAELKKCMQAIALQIGQALSRERIVSSLRKAEHEQQQARKMEAVGMLAGGIAHDFNNLMTVVLGNCEMLQSQPFDESQTLEMVEEIRVISERAATLTKKLLGFSRKRAVQPEVLNPTRILKECMGMLERVVGSNIALETNVPEDIPPILIDRIEFEQIVLNLVANARDAMPTGGKISISLANMTLELKDVLHHDDIRSGDYVSLTVADNGCGMDEATQARAFEPFFTTKGAEKGTGLGLATVYGIVRRCRGIVQLKSTVGEGTQFKIVLPRAAVGIKPRSVHTPVLADPRGSETILVVEDEDSLRRLVQRVLEVHGYTVMTADRGAAALELLRSGQKCDLLLTDIVMPGMNGRALGAEARKLFPDLPMLYMSGFHELDESSADADDTRLLSKPFSSDVLTMAVRTALDGVRS